MEQQRVRGEKVGGGRIARTSRSGTKSRLSERHGLRVQEEKVNEPMAAGGPLIEPEYRVLAFITRNRSPRDSGSRHAAHTACLSRF